MGQELDLNQVASSMKNLQEHGQKTAAVWDPEGLVFRFPSPSDPIPDGIPINDAAAGKFYTK